MTRGTDGKASAREAFEEGSAFEARGDLKRSLASFKLAAERAPRRAECFEAVARVLEAMGKISQAMDWYMRAAQVRDDEANPEVTKAKWFYDLAEEREWALGLQPNNLGQDEVVPAVEHLERLIARFGPDSTAFRKLALLLPGMSGFDTLRALRKNHSSLAPVVVLTSMDGGGTRTYAIKPNKADAFVTKAELEDPANGLVAQVRKLTRS